MNSKYYNEDLDYKWKKKKLMVSDADINSDSYFNLPPMLTGKFYISSYKCPLCHTALYKTVFPIGGEMPIWTEAEDVFLKRVFACNNCNAFIAPDVGKPLNSGNIFVLTNLNDNKYKNLIDTYTKFGTTDGRMDY